MVWVMKVLTEIGLGPEGEVSVSLASVGTGLGPEEALCQTKLYWAQWAGQVLDGGPKSRESRIPVSGIHLILDYAVRAHSLGSYLVCAIIGSITLELAILVKQKGQKLSSI